MDVFVHLDQMIQEQHVGMIEEQEQSRLSDHVIIGDRIGVMMELVVGVMHIYMERDVVVLFGVAVEIANPDIMMMDVLVVKLM